MRSQKILCYLVRPVESAYGVLFLKPFVFPQKVIACVFGALNLELYFQEIGFFNPVFIGWIIPDLGQLT